MKELELLQSTPSPSSPKHLKKSNRWHQERKLILSKFIKGPLPYYITNPSDKEVKELKLKKCKTPKSANQRKLKSRLKNKAPIIADTYEMMDQDNEDDENNDMKNDDNEDEDSEMTTNTTNKTKRYYTQFERMNQFLDNWFEEIRALHEPRLNDIPNQWDIKKEKIYKEFEKSTNRRGNRIYVDVHPVCHKYIIYFY